MHVRLQFVSNVCFLLTQGFLTGPYCINIANVWIIHGNGCFHCAISLNARKRSRARTARLSIRLTVVYTALRDRKFILRNSSFP